MSNQLTISFETQKDLLGIKNYISLELDNPDTAIRFISKILKSIYTLTSVPEMGTPLSSVIDIKTDIRFLIINRYIIFYRYDTEIISVLRVLHGNRDHLHLLFKSLPPE